VGASCLLVPVNVSPDEVTALKGLLVSVGFKTVQTATAREHDKMIAFTSQACHAVSASYCLHPLSALHEGFSAGSFRDLTRVARLNALMWTELFCDNADELVPTLDEFIKQVSELKRAIETRDEAQVYRILAAANEARERIKEDNR